MALTAILVITFLILLIIIATCVCNRMLDKKYGLFTEPEERKVESEKSMDWYDRLKGSKKEEEVSVTDHLIQQHKDLYPEEVKEMTHGEILEEILFVYKEHFEELLPEECGTGDLGNDEVQTYCMLLREKRMLKKKVVKRTTVAHPADEDADDEDEDSV